RVCEELRHRPVVGDTRLLPVGDLFEQPAELLPPFLVQLQQFGLDAHSLTCPSPRTMYLYEVISTSAIGPRACSFWLEMPISAPKPNSPPSAKRVEALTMTHAESTSREKRSAADGSSVTIASVWLVPWTLIRSIASSKLPTTPTARMRSRYSASQSSSAAGTIEERIARALSSP